MTNPLTPQDRSAFYGAAVIGLRALDARETTPPTPWSPTARRDGRSSAARSVRATASTSCSVTPLERGAPRSRRRSLRPLEVQPSLGGTNECLSFSVTHEPVPPLPMPTRSGTYLTPEI